MDISAVIAANLSAWMEATPELETVQKVEAKSGVGFGTVRRARKGEGNLTVEKLAAIAAAFGRTAADLVTPQDASYAALIPSSNRQAPAVAAESTPSPFMRWPFPHADQRAYESLPPEGQVWVQGRLDAAIEQARQQFGTQTEKRSA